MTPRFEAWQVLLADQNQLFLNLSIIVLAWLSIWILHLRKSRRLQILAWIGVYLVYYGSLVYSYLVRGTGS